MAVCFPVVVQLVVFFFRWDRNTSFLTQFLFVGCFWIWPESEVTSLVVHHLELPAELINNIKIRHEKIKWSVSKWDVPTSEPFNPSLLVIQDNTSTIHVWVWWLGQRWILPHLKTTPSLHCCSSSSRRYSSDGDTRKTLGNSFLTVT